MTTISAKVVLDSVSSQGARITTMSLKYPRWIHAELMTHRVFCRNASSSRAIPTLKMLQSIAEDPAHPLHLGKNQAGMQAYSQIEGESKRKAVYHLWNEALRSCIASAKDMHSLFGAAKQVVNRLTEHSQHISVLVTATEWDNFFALRCHPAAEPHIRALAWKMADIYYRDSTPSLMKDGDWHLPYVDSEDVEERNLYVCQQLSAARCARVSYNNHDGSDPDVDKDLELFARLVPGSLQEDSMEPIHASPLEHQATPLSDPTEFSGPLKGWLQFRKTLDKEVMSFDYKKALASGWREDALSILEEVPPKP